MTESDGETTLPASPSAEEAKKEKKKKKKEKRVKLEVEEPDETAEEPGTQVSWSLKVTCLSPPVLNQRNIWSWKKNGTD